MAKVNAPLFSFNAAGKLANSLVYFGWKGLDVVRSYVTPSNPKTAAQTTQRGYFTAAVDAIHAALALAANPLDAADKAAYALLASTRANPRTWFNEIVKIWADAKVAGDAGCIYSNGTISDPTHDSIDLVMYLNEEGAATIANGKFYFGITKTSLIHSKAATVVPNTTVALTNEDCSAFLSAGEKYYVQFRPDAADPCEGSVSGIYSFTAT
jgi:hypothetical protein